MSQTWDAKNYAENGAFVHELAGGVVEWLAACKGEQILDLGCGDGQLTARIAASGALMHGLDASAAMVEAARGRGIDAAVGQAEALPFVDGSFDAVFSNAALHWVRGQKEMMREVRRVLRPQGRFVAEMGGMGNVAAIRVALSAVCGHHGVGEEVRDRNFYPSPAAYRQRLEAAGFAVERIELIPRPTPLPVSGMAGWIETFCRGQLNQLPADMRQTVVSEAVALLQPVLCDEQGNWTADYMRLRFIARPRP